MTLDDYWKFNDSRLTNHTVEILLNLGIEDISEISGKNTTDFIDMCRNYFFKDKATEELLGLGYLVEPEDAIKVEDLDISSRLRNVLLRNGIIYLSQVATYSKEELLKFRNMGERTREELISICEVYGIKIWSVGHLPDDFRHSRIHPRIYANMYNRGIKTIYDLSGKTLGEIEELCEGDKDIAGKIRNMMKKKGVSVSAEI